MQTEYEIKYLSINKDEIRQKLVNIGAKLHKKEHLMKRKVFDFKNPIVKEGEYKWVRVRDEGDKITATIKYINDLKSIEGTKEVEIEVNNFDNMVAFLENLDLVLTNYQENYREEWLIEGVQVTIDSWPGLDSFIEIEAGSEDKVKKISNELGFNYNNAIFGSVDVVYERQLKIPLNGLKDIPILTFDNWKEALGEYIK